MFYPPWKRWYFLRSRPLPEGGVATFFQDITERKLAEIALRESEQRFRNLADYAPVMVWVTEPNGVCTYLNCRWYEFTGQDPAAAAGFGWLDAVHPEDRAHTEKLFLEATHQHQSFRVEYRLRRRDGEWRWTIDAAAPRFC